LQWRGAAIGSRPSWNGMSKISIAHYGFDLFCCAQGLFFVSIFPHLLVFSSIMTHALHLAVLFRRGFVFAALVELFDAFSCM
jgi:hypothetical protein